MSRMAGLLARMRALLGRRSAEQRMQTEFALHVELETEQNLKRGMPPGEARRRALIAFGGTEQYREEMREGRGLAVPREILRDARLSLRMFRREPAFSLSVIATLALAIGATTAVFTLMRRAVLEGPPFPDSGRLLSLATRYAAWGLPYSVLSEPELQDLEAMTGTFSGVGAWVMGPADLARDDGSQAERVRGLLASAALLPVLQVTPVLGRTFRPEEDLPGAAPVVLLSHALWRRLGGDSSLVGKEIWLNSIRQRVIGVLPPSFDFNGAELVTPLRLDRAHPAGRAAHWLDAVARLAPGVSVSQAGAALELTSARLRREYTEYPADLKWSLVGRSLQDQVLGNAGEVLGFLVGAVVLVLLIACANVANLSLARLSRKEREVALRGALGAGRARLVRQLLTEGLVLALIGGAAGIALATVGTNALLALSPGAMPKVSRLGVDVGMLLTTIGLAGGSALLFGLAPAWRGTRTATRAPAIGRGTSAEGWGSGARGFMATLVTTEVALATVVVIWAGLLVRSYQRLSGVDLGFQAGATLAFDLTVPRENYPTSDQVTAFVERVRGELEQLPGVQHAGGVRSLPLRSSVGRLDIEVEGKPPLAGQAPNFQVVTPGYFEAMGIRLVQGRLPTSGDNANTPISAWVNTAAATSLWPGEPALGRRFRFAGDTGSKWFSVVGIVSDVRTTAATQAPVAEYFLAHAQLPRAIRITQFHRGLSLVVRTAGDPERLAGPVRAVLKGIDPRVAPARVEPMRAVASRAIARQRLVAMLLSAFGLLAAVLAAVGIYGVLSYSVSRRTKEIGIRLALGARGAEVVRLMARQGLEAAGLGIGLGALLALLASRVVSAMLYGIGPRDPVVLGGSVVGLGLLALLAALIPAQRAARVQPIETLRAE